jgi:hypothetical protein
LSQAAGHGVRIATIWQSLAQAEHRYGRAADEIVASSTSDQSPTARRASTSPICSATSRSTRHH